MLDRQDDLVRRLVGACRRGDVAELHAALDAGVVAVCDTRPTRVGAPAVAGLLVELFGNHDELTIESVNGRAGLALRQEGRAVAVVAVKAADTGIAFLWIVLSPAKLHGWHRR
ncbi:hypothetical protein GCM10009687_24170 [Asanoa iriomotensis]|uniref:RNA polymerase sigma-70 factor (ECF subfamily) n=2 Tax=Asanoa iriomotensis TaxID=234613 RepID=A0ABQ4BX29_9ACTN|nr:hypothetical protein Air01nite_11870 [Asanoa iriomotensis]